MPINVTDAILKTFTVSIKVMKVGKRQMTLAVFRQLQSEQYPVTDLPPGSRRTRGVIPKYPENIWGIVNYSWSGSAHDAHIVWQKGDELRRTGIDGYTALLLKDAGVSLDHLFIAT